MSTTELSKNTPQEIDLLDLFKSIGKGISSFFIQASRFLVFLVIFGIRKAHYILLSIGIGIAVGILFFNISKRYYSSDMVAQTNGISSSDMIGYINNLHDLCKDGNSEALAIELQLPDTTAKKIKDIQAFFIVDLNMDGIGDFVDYENKIDLSDTTQSRLPDRVHVAVEVFDNNAFSFVGKGLLQYMKNNPYMLQLNQIRIQELKELINQTSYEIDKLDSLQNTDYFQNHTQLSKQSSQMMILAEKEPTMYYENKFQLIKQKHELQRELLLTTDAFTVIKDFSSLAVAENPLGSYIKRYVVLFFILGYVCTLGITYRGKLSTFVS